MLAYYFRLLLGTALSVLPFAALVRVGVVFSASRVGKGGRTTLWHEAGMVSLYLYLCGLFLLTVNYMRLLQWRFTLPSSYNLIPFQGMASIAEHGSFWYILLNLWGNVLVFIPLGLLLPLLWRRWDSRWRTVLLGAGISLGIEVLQLFTGRSADIDDVMLNTLGVFLGHCGYQVLQSAWPGLAEGFRWSFREQTGDSGGLEQGELQSQIY